MTPTRAVAASLIGPGKPISDVPASSVAGVVDAADDAFVEGMRAACWSPRRSRPGRGSPVSLLRLVPERTARSTAEEVAESARLAVR